MVGAVAAFGLMTATLAFIALWEIVPLFGGWPWPPLLPLDGYYENITLENMKPGPDGKVSPAHIAKAEWATWQELRLSPMATEAWLRLAILQTLKTPDHLNSVGVDALRKSFIVAPLDPVYCGDRDILALNYWTDLDIPLRQKVLTEIEVTWRPPTVVGPDVIPKWRSEVHNFAGQFALSYALRHPKP